jgi:hypothetical protein
VGEVKQAGKKAVVSVLVSLENKGPTSKLCPCLCGHHLQPDRKVGWRGTVRHAPHLAVAQLSRNGSLLFAPTLPRPPNRAAHPPTPSCNCLARGGSGLDRGCPFPRVCSTGSGDGINTYRWSSDESRTQTGTWRGQKFKESVTQATGRVGLGSENRCADVPDSVGGSVCFNTSLPSTPLRKLRWSEAFLFVSGRIGAH